MILGAGPSGLGVALGLKLQGFDGSVQVVEKKAQVGGLSGSYKWRGHAIDYGPHRLSSALENIRILAQELLGPDSLILKSQHGVQYRRRLYQFPPRVVDWLSPLPLIELVLFANSYFWSKLRWVTVRFDRETFESTICRKFGRRFFQAIVAPMTEKVWAAPAEIDPAFVNQRFSVVHPWTVVKKILFPKQEQNPSLFFYPRGGFQQLWERVRSTTEDEHCAFQLQTEPMEIRVRDGKIHEVVFKTAQGEQVVNTANSAVVSTIPITIFLQLLKGVAKDEMLEWSQQIRFRSMLLVAFEFEQPRVLPYRTLIFPETQYCFNRLFEQDLYSRSTVTAGKSVVVADITFDRGGSWSQKSDQEIVELVKADMRRLKFVPIEKIVATAVERVEFAYVVPNMTGRAALYNIVHELKKIRNLHLLGRFSVGEYDNSDFALENGIALAGMLANRFPPLDYLKMRYRSASRVVIAE